MKTLLVSFTGALALFFTVGCLMPKLPTNIPGNAGQKLVVSNLTLSTPWGTEKIEYMESRTVENLLTNVPPIPLAPTLPHR